MKDNLTAHFRNGLAGHEMDVPPGVWEHVGGQLAAAASGEALRSVLQEKFRGHEAEVNPSAWGNISGQLGHGTAAGGSFSLGWIAAGVAAVGLVASLLYLNNNEASDSSNAATVLTGAAAQQPAQTPIPSAKPVMTEPVAAQPTAPVPTTEPTPPVRQSTPPVVLHQIRTTTSTDQAKTTASANAAKATPEQPLVFATPAALASKSADQTSGSKSAQGTEPRTPLEKSAVQHDLPDAAKPERRDSHDQPAAAQSGSEMPNGNADPFAQDEAAEHILIPNAFSPNGDALNENFEIVLRDYSRVDVRVFSAQTGALVFQTDDLARKWDGRLPNGNFAEEGNYQCVVNWADREGHSHSKNVTVRLFR